MVYWMVGMENKVINLEDNLLKTKTVKQTSIEV
jgi:hypothetical protein